MKSTFTAIFLSVVIIFPSCESDAARNRRVAAEELQQTELRQRTIEEEQATAIHVEAERAEREKQEATELAEREARSEQERREQAIRDRYMGNSLQTGATPYARYYGSNSTCDDNGCSQINVRTSNSDVLVTIKSDNEVVRHAFIQAGDSYSFSFPNGTYQAFFYYGKGWNPEKEMKNGLLQGGFISNEDFGKDDPQSLYNNVLRYELILQQNGNFSTRPSSPDEAL